MWSRLSLQLQRVEQGPVVEAARKQASSQYKEEFCRMWNCLAVEPTISHQQSSPSLGIIKQRLPISDGVWIEKQFDNIKKRTSGDFRRLKIPSISKVLGFTVADWNVPGLFFFFSSCKLITVGSIRRERQGRTKEHSLPFPSVLLVLPTKKEIRTQRREMGQKGLRKEASESLNWMSWGENR